MAPRENANLELRVAEPIAAEGSAAPSSLRFPETFLVLAKRKMFLLKTIFAGAVLSLLIALLLPKIYTATTRIMPPQQNQSLSMTAMMSQLGPLAALAGQGLGIRNPSDIYVSMLRSDTVADALVDRFSLMQVYHMKFHIDARKALTDRSTVTAGKDGVITIAVEDKDAKRAADLANGYVEELENLTKILAVSEAAQRRVFFERETKEAMDDLASAEVALKQTQEKTGLILLDPQSRAIIDQVASLRARIAAQQVLISSMSSYATSQNPELVRARNELAALQGQLENVIKGQGTNQSTLDLPIENVPTAGLEYVRKLREVKYREALFELLAKQFEAAKIDEARDTFLVQQLDRAKIPEKKSWPSRALIVIVGTLVVCFMGIVTALFMERLEKARDDPHFASQLQLFRFYVRNRRE